MTRRERLEGLRERRLKWARLRAEKSAGLLKSTEHLRGDWAFITQPGHIPERARVIARIDRAMKHGEMANCHEAKAGGLAWQLDRTIFSDDADASERLVEKAAHLRSRREWCSKVNAAWRKAKKPKADDTTGWAGIAASLGVEPEALREGRLNMARDFVERGPYPPYVLSNLGAEIRRCEKRIDEVKRRMDAVERAAQSGGVAIQRGEHGYCAVTFSEKPGHRVLDALRAAHFHWGCGSWSGRTDALPPEVLDMERSAGGEGGAQ